MKLEIAFNINSFKVFLEASAYKFKKLRPKDQQKMDLYWRWIESGQWKSATGEEAEAESKKVRDFEEVLTRTFAVTTGSWWVVLETIPIDHHIFKTKPKLTFGKTFESSAKEFGLV